MKRVLALDTATTECAVGLGTWPDAPAPATGIALGERNVSQPRAALTHLVPVVRELLEACSLQAADVGVIVVGRGPGSFTGVRIGVSTAKGLAHGLSIPVVGVGTLDAIAERCAGEPGLIGVVGDAMRREVYPALFRAGADGTLERLEADSVCTPAEVAARWAAAYDEPIRLAGDGLHKYADVFGEALGERSRVTPTGLWTPTGGSLLAAAWRVGLGSACDAAAILPVYTRLSDAEQTEALRSGRDPLLPATGVAGPDGGRT